MPFINTQKIRYHSTSSTSQTFVVSRIIKTVVLLENYLHERSAIHQQPLALSKCYSLLNVACFNLPPKHTQTYQRVNATSPTAPSYPMYSNFKHICRTQKTTEQQLQYEKRHRPEWTSTASTLDMASSPPPG
jgi:hypothetical protein